MSNYPINIWLIDESEFEKFTFTGGKVIYIVEEPSTIYKNHPAIVTAGALLPPIEGISAELENDIIIANSIYCEYLLREDADLFVSTIIAAAIQQVPIGIMFGRDELNMQFPKMFIDFLYHYYGLVIGIQNKVIPYIEESFMPFDLAKLYNMNIIDYKTFMMKHPNIQIHPSVISKLAYEINPVVKEKDYNNYAEYFEYVKNTIQKDKKFLVDPLEGI